MCRRRNGARETDTPSPFAGVIADEKSWLKGQVPGFMMSFNARIQLQGAQDPTFLKLPTKRPILAWCGSIYRRTVLKAGGTRWVVPPRISRHLRKGRGHIIPGPTLPKLDRWAERVFARGLVRDLFGTCVAGFDQDRRFLSIALRSSADV